MKRTLLMLFVVAMLVPSGMNVVKADMPAEIVMPDAATDSVKALGILVEKNKVSNNQMAIHYAKIALSIAQKTNSPENLVDAYGWMGIAYLLSIKDTSYFYFNKAMNLADSCKMIDQRVNIFYNLASLQSAAYNYKEATYLFDSSLRLAQKVKNYSGIANAYIALGLIKVNIHEYESARSMFDSALSISRRHNLNKQIGVALGNLARKPIERDSIKLINLQKEALFYLSKVEGAEEEMAAFYINIGNQKQNPDSALFYYKAALKVATAGNLSKLLFGAYNNMAYSYLDKKDIVNAEACLRDKAIPLALEKKDYDWLSSLYDTYADVCVAKGDYKSALDFQRKAMSARKKDYMLKGAEQVRLVSAQLDLKSKELIIQNEEKELLLQRNRLQQAELWLAIALLLVVGAVFSMLILQQRNRAKIQREQVSSARRIIEMEETEKGRVARELHDLTGQLVLGISGTIENIDFPDPVVKEQVKARIKDLGASMRKISHRMNRAMIEHFTFSEMITGLCEDVQKLSKMQIDLEMSDEFPDLPNDFVLHFYRISQELLTNAGKYASESQVKIKVLATDDTLTLTYSDNGPGFNVGEQTKPSMGVLNIYERAKMVGGHAKLTTAPGKGTSWEIIFPIIKKV